ncbi:hypothetical protein KSP35_08105 [Aquihabitans sp. G128]|uniref:hypothetical protein n=1 Tax=Aquihabitans sp. G128 TaxID=2849779 RepID=UPI001C2312A1|nr:hypothetical protein [Aquihabitans sp. G128]QXC62741.1 hypothetical protein KSP35_08105 [Aquihabitans sp. G128]
MAFEPTIRWNPTTVGGSSRVSLDATPAARPAPDTRAMPPRRALGVRLSLMAASTHRSTRSGDEGSLGRVRPVRGFRVRDGLHAEAVEGALLVLDPRSSKVFELTGDQAEAFRLAEAGSSEVPAELTTAMAALVELGLVKGNGWDRRRVLLAGGAAAAATVAVLALPSAAAAQSAPGGGGTSGPTVPDAPTITSIEQRATLPRGTRFRVTYSTDNDGGSPVFASTIWADGTPVAHGDPTIGVFITTPGASIQVSLINSVGDSPLSAPVIAVWG